ncbi:MAG: DUF3052 domain-containing protein, partial [Patescibacteria group bacterium]|nr:DUF3052 domain-containing protein [Patescibacteria group bacterium]
PEAYLSLLGKLPKETKIQSTLKGNAEFIHFFTRSQEQLQEEFPKLKTALAKNGTLWISWPKGACNIRTDLNENIVRRIGLENSLVDVKICSIDEMWSALKFVYRLKDR